MVDKFAWSEFEQLEARVASSWPPSWKGGGAQDVRNNAHLSKVRLRALGGMTNADKFGSGEVAEWSKAHPC